MHSGRRNHSSLSRGPNNRFAVHNDKTSYAFTVTLHDDFLDFPEPLRGFHIDDSTSDQLTSFDHFASVFLGSQRNP
jgi:hypothetical protein